MKWIIITKDSQQRRQKYTHSRTLALSQATYEVTLNGDCEIIPQRPHQMSHAKGFTHHFYDAMRYDAILTSTLSLKLEQT